MYAVVTARYDHLEGAINCLIEDCNVVFPGEPQMELFDPKGGAR